MSREEQVSDIVAAALAHFGTLDTIVNNAGFNDLQKLEEHTAEDWMRILAVDLLGAFYFIKHAFLNMPKVAP